MQSFNYNLQPGEQGAGSAVAESANNNDFVANNWMTCHVAGWIDCCN